MANVKRIIAPYDETGVTLYAIIERDSDGYLLNDADGSFASAPADPYLALTEATTVKRTYRKDESRLQWQEALHRAWVYKQAGGSPSPVADSLVVSLDLYVKDDMIVSEAAYLADIRQRVQQYLTADVSTLALSADVNTVLDYLMGTHTLNPSADTLTITRRDGSTVLVTFDLTENSTGTRVPSYLARTPQ